MADCIGRCANLNYIVLRIEPRERSQVDQFA